MRTPSTLLRRSIGGSLVAVALAALLAALLLPSDGTPKAQPAPPEDPDGQLLFGLGPTATSARDHPLTEQVPVRMLSTWYNDPADLEWLDAWRDTVIPEVYAEGFAHHLIVYNAGAEGTTDTPHGPACGLTYPLSERFDDDMRELAELFSGDGPLYVTMFTEFQTYPCVENQWEGAEAYYRALQDRFLAAQRIFHDAHPDAYVALGWGGWQSRWDDPAVGGGRSLIGHFEEVLEAADYQAFQAMETDGGNPEVIAEMTDLLSPYGPVMLAHYLPDDESGSEWDADIAAVLTPDNVAALSDAGLFAFAFMDPLLLDDADRLARTVEAARPHAATWLVPPWLERRGQEAEEGVTRLHGRTRVETAVAISEDRFPASGSADAVVLARADDFADALAGTPLAVDRDGPVLLTDSNELEPAVAAEITRVLGSGGVIHLLGGPSALADDVERAAGDLAPTERLGGDDRYATALTVAGELGDRSSILLATGERFPDALAAGAAAGADGLVLLVPGETRHGDVDAYLERMPDATVHAVGGPAARAYPEAEALAGADRIETAVLVAERFHPDPASVALVRADHFADAVAGGPHVASRPGPMLLTGRSELSSATGQYLSRLDTVDELIVYGGEDAVPRAVAEQAAAQVSP